MTHNHYAQTQPGTRNGVSAHINGTKEKPKTVYIKLHPKPNAPRHSAIKPAHSRLQPR
jgi:hypothetical protein